MAVEAEREFLEIGLKVSRAEAVMDAAQPCLEMGEHEVNEGQEGLGNLPVAPFRSGSMKLPAPSERRVAAPVVGDDGGAWRNGASDRADPRFGATIRRHAEQDFRAFEVLNLGRYEWQAYLNVDGRLTGTHKEQALAQKENEFRELILRLYKATGFGGGECTQAQAGFFHGARNGRLVVIGPINLPAGRLFVEEVITECRKRGASCLDVLAFEFEMGLFPAVLEEARNKGIDLTQYCSLKLVRPEPVEG